MKRWILVLGLMFLSAASAGASLSSLAAVDTGRAAVAELGGDEDEDDDDEDDEEDRA